MAPRPIDAIALLRALLFDESGKLDADAALFVFSIIAEQPTLPAWRAVTDPPEMEELVLAKVTGRCGNVRFKDAVLLARRYDDGWELEDYPRSAEFTVSRWAPIPEEQ